MIVTTLKKKKKVRKYFWVIQGWRYDQARGVRIIIITFFSGLVL